MIKWSYFIGCNVYHNHICISGELVISILVWDKVVVIIDALAFWYHSFYCSGGMQLNIFYNINSLAPGKFEWNFRHAIFKKILVIDGWGIYYEIDLIRMSLDFTDDQPTLVQVMAWCCQATSHYLSQCWPRSLSPYGVIRPQWVNPSVMERFCGTSFFDDNPLQAKFSIRKIK